ncbi:MAG TPA: helix-turn-helix domain-containing protein [Blastocatellia bacterium]|nr:helix-turn-helix domain-containing protein [Blastocatellia bacterium]
MSKTGKQGLSRYVERVMKEKHLSRRDVKLRSGGEITDSYVSGIINGSAKNLSVDKLKALARGLRVREMELIRVAFGLSDEPLPKRVPDQSHNLLLLDITRKTVIGNDIAEIVQEVIRLSPGERAIVLQYVKRLGKVDRRAQRKRRSV